MESFLIVSAVILSIGLILSLVEIYWQKRILNPNSSPGPVGIGGWFLIPLFSITLSTLLSFALLIFTFTGDELELAKTAFNVPSQNEMAFLRLPIIGNTILNIVSFILGATCIYFVYKRSHKLIEAATILFVVLILSAIFDYWAGGVYKLVASNSVWASDENARFPAIFATALWIVYLHKSRRVRNTFVN